ncbi:nitrilase family protein [Flavobacterium sp.]|uniref:nitrilase family protein n=1 Tax=Flavobacterium sp. TaxID=239 RepID=UPI00286C6705|nr:nitrilase family protein [Flavobacterium sp.]
MKIAIIQTQLFWENPSENRKHFEQKINSISENIDLIVLTEMFTSGFTMNPEIVAETMSGESIQLLESLAKAKNCAITGSLVIAENNNFYNRMIFVSPDRNIEFYDKKHLFTLAGENKVYTAGNQKKIVEFRDFKICLQICYDLRFPVFARNIEDYDLIIYVANWPKPRINAWDILLKARAVENMCFVIGANRIGVDENKNEYTGHSQAIDFLGNVLFKPEANEGVFITTLDKNAMNETRQKLGFLNDGDIFTMQ